MTSLDIGIGLTTSRPMVLSGAALLAQATARFSASSITTGTEQSLPNLNGSGELQRGSTAGIDANDPAFIGHTENHAYIPTPASANGNQILTSGVTSPTGATVTMIVDVAVETLSQNCQVGGIQNAFHPYFQGSDNSIRVVIRSATSGPQYVTFGAHGLAAGQRAKFRFTRTKATGVTTGEKSTDGGDTWTPLPSSPSAAIGAGEDLFTSTVLRWGSGIVPQNSAVKVWPLTLDGLKHDPTQGAISRSATGLKTAAITGSVILSDGSSDYLQSSITPTWTKASGSASYVWAGRWWHDPTLGQFWSSESGLDNGASLQITGLEARFYVGDGATTERPIINAAAAYGDKAVIICIVDNGATRIWSEYGGMSADADLSLLAGTVTHDPIRVNSPGYTVNGANNETTEPLIVFDRALTLAECEALAAGL